jgi:tripeptide aminopeptidase
MKIDEVLKELAARPPVARARAALHETDTATLEEQLELVGIAAPPFGEEVRGDWLRRRFRQLGLADVAADEVGNVLGRLPGAAERGPPVLVSAHLDTVFPADTDLTVTREDGRFLAPGIADNCRGLAALLAIARVLREAGVATVRPLVFVGTVGEEGVGDLRGVKHLFREGSPWRRAAAFFSIDGTGLRRIVHRGIGSRRLRVTYSGPGGHSWADWGRPNPVHALSSALAELARLPLPARPRTTFTAARIGGGTSVNAIPAEAWTDLDLRSEDGAALRELEERVRGGLQAALSASNGDRRRGALTLRLAIEVIGDRPGGETATASRLVVAARAATRLLGQAPELVASSTDANVPMALGIPAVTMGAGGESGGTHTLGEWYSNEGGATGIERVLLAILAVAGVAA